MKVLDDRIEKVEGYTLSMKSLSGKTPYIGMGVCVPRDKLEHPTLIVGGWVIVEYEDLGGDRLKITLRPRRYDELGIAESIDEDVFRNLYASAGLPLPGGPKLQSTA